MHQPKSTLSLLSNTFKKNYFLSIIPWSYSKKSITVFLICLIFLQVQHQGLVRLKGWVQDCLSQARYFYQCLFLISRIKLCLILQIQHIFCAYIIFYKIKNTERNTSTTALQIIQFSDIYSFLTEYSDIKRAVIWVTVLPKLLTLPMQGPVVLDITF